MKLVLTILLLYVSASINAQDIIKTANDCYDKKDYACAAENYKQAINLKKYQDKDWAEINYRIGVCLSNEKKYAECIPFYKEALKNKPDWEYINYSIGWNYQKLKEYSVSLDYYNKAIPYYQKSTTQKSFIANIHYAISGNYFEQKKYPEAISACEKSISINPEYYEAYHQAGDASHNFDKFEDAIKYYNKAIKIGTDKKETLSNVYRFRGRAKNEISKYEEALEDANKALELNPNNNYIYWDIAAVYYNQKKYADAIKYYEKCIELIKDDKTSMQSIYYWYARALNNNAQYTKASTAIDNAISIDNSNGNYFALKGDIQYNNAYYSKAIEAYKESIRLAPDTLSKKKFAIRYRWLGKAQAKNYNYNEAITSYKKSIELDPSLKAVIWDHAAALYSSKKYNEAIKEYSKCIPLYKEKDELKSLTELYYWRSYSYFNIKQFDKALIDINEALKINSDSSEGILQKGKILLELKKYKEAIPVYTKALDIAKKNYKNIDAILLQRGRSYLYSKDTANAIIDLKESAVKNSYNKSAAVELGNIYFTRKDYSNAYYQYSNGFYGYDADTATLSALHFKKGFCYRHQGYSYTAKADFIQSVKYDSTNKEAQRYLAESYYHDKMYDLSLKHFTKCIQLYKNVKDSLHKMYAYRGMAYSQQKKYKSALTEYELAEKNKPNDAGYLTDIGRLAFEVKEYQKAINAFKKSIPLYKPTQKSELAFAYFAKGRCEEELKNKVQAKLDISKAVEILPTYTEAKNWLEKNK